MAIVLASQSPRRQELLARIGVEDFKTLSLDIDESYPEGLSPEDTVRYIAKKKCDAAAALCAPDDLIITADTMVFLGNDRLGKPHDETDAFRMLRALSGRVVGAIFSLYSVEIYDILSLCLRFLLRPLNTEGGVSMDGITAFIVAVLAGITDHCVCKLLDYMVEFSRRKPKH